MRSDLRLLLLTAPLLAALPARAAVFGVPEVPITQTIDIQPIDVCNSTGKTCAPVGLVNAYVAYADLMFQQAGVAFVPLPEPEPPPSSVPRPVARIVMHPGSSPRVRGLQLGVLLVDSDRVGRTTLARAFLRAQSNVTLVDSVADLVAVINAEEVVDVMLLDASHPAAQAIVEVLVHSRPGAAVVARGGDLARTRAFLTQLGVTRFDVRSREAPAEELIDAMKRAAEG